MWNQAKHTKEILRILVGNDETGMTGLELKKASKGLLKTYSMYFFLCDMEEKCLINSRYFNGRRYYQITKAGLERATQEQG